MGVKNKKLEIRREKNIIPVKRRHNLVDTKRGS